MEWEAYSISLNISLAGAGKTILASTAINYLSSWKFSTTALTFVYCRYDDERTALGLLLSMIRQMVEDHHLVAYRIVKPIFEDKQLKKGTLELEDAVFLYTSLLKPFQIRRAVIDGLDELVNSEKEKLLGVLKALPVQLLIFSRPLPLFERYLPSVTFLSIEAQNEDITKMVIAAIHSDRDLCEITGKKPGIVEEIASKVQAKSRGM